MERTSECRRVVLAIIQRQQFSRDPTATTHHRDQDTEHDQSEYNERMRGNMLLIAWHDELSSFMVGSATAYYREARPRQRRAMLLREDAIGEVSVGVHRQSVSAPVRSKHVLCVMHVSDLAG